MSVPYATATTDEKAEFNGLLNLACERLLTLGRWRGLRQRANIPIVDGMITLPRYYDSCLGVNYSSCSCSNRELFGMYYPYQGAGNEYCSNSVIAISETAQTFVIPNEGFQLKVVSNVADNAKTVSLIGGVDSNGQIIFVTETLTLNAAVPPTSTTVYNSLPRILKASTTYPVELYSVIGATEELIGYYAPSETIPSYKQYRVSNWGNATSVDALCKVAFIPASADTDLIMPPVLGALAKAIKAVVYERASDDRDQALWAQAMKILEDDRAELDGKMMPVVEVIGSFGMGDTPNLIGDYYGATYYPGNNYNGY